VVVLSDGWDRGDPELLRREVARLGRCAQALVWLNPLKASPGYEPLTRGMVAALPYVDAFLAGNSLASLEQLAALMESGFAGQGRGRGRVAGAASMWMTQSQGSRRSDEGSARGARELDRGGGASGDRDRGQHPALGAPAAGREDGDQRAR